MKNDDWSGYGKNWDKLRKKVYKRDNYTCQRCGYHSDTKGRSVPLQAHHIIHRSDGGKDTMDNLITLCRSCHGVQHPDNETFDDDRPDAPLFPHVDAPSVVDDFPDSVSRRCNRCKNKFSIEELAGIPKSFVNNCTYGLPVCKSCAGIICYNSDSDLDMNDLESKTPVNRDNTIKNRYKSHPYSFNNTTQNIVDKSRECVNKSEKLLLYNFTRKYGTWITIVLLGLFIHFIVSPIYFPQSHELSSLNSLVDTFILTILFVPLIRWLGATILYKMITAFDATHKKSHYTPKITTTISHMIEFYIYAFIILSVIGIFSLII